MKQTLVVLAFALALALAATAQEDLNFAELPLVSSPTPMPNGYGQFNWNNIFYVDPYHWSGAGSGYRDGPIGRDVAFIGGRICRAVQEACYGTITSDNPHLVFEPVSATMAGGFGPTYVTATAYNSGNYVGSMSFPLGTGMRTLHFPVSWGFITQLTLQTDMGGDLVLYDLQAYLAIKDPPPH
jgi:hypothetical protein